MKIMYELYNHWTEYGRPGGTQLDFDVRKGTNFEGRFETREAAQLKIKQLQEQYANPVISAKIQDAFDDFEIKEVKVKSETETPPRA